MLVVVVEFVWFCYGGTRDCYSSAGIAIRLIAGCTASTRQKNKQANDFRGCIELIASENFTSRAVMECLGSALTNKPGPQPSHKSALSLSLHYPYPAVMLP